MDCSLATEAAQMRSFAAAVDVTLYIDYPQGPMERWSWRFEPGGTPSTVDVRLPHPDAGNDPTSMDWTLAHGSTLFERALGMVGMQVFGGPQMPPRVTGAPLWSGVRASVSCAGQVASFALTASGSSTAVLHYRGVPLRQAPEGDRPAAGGARPASGGPLQLCGDATLTLLDADPIRAACRFGSNLGALLEETHARLQLRHTGGDGGDASSTGGEPEPAGEDGSAPVRATARASGAAAGARTRAARSSRRAEKDSRPLAAESLVRASLEPALYA